ncbi:MAG: glutathione S-transferase domain-containing protein [Polyangiaceae bacterium]|nr:glutathione S-transferase domain-containing protein [Polyangiaceae bacterium]
MVYSVALQDRTLVTELWSHGGPVWGRAFHWFAYPAVAAVVKRMYRTHHPREVAASKELFRTTFDQLDAILRRQRYFGGDRPNRLDVTSAALLAPLCRPPEHHMAWPEAPAPLREFETSLKGRPTWEHALRMYRDHRRSSADA